MRTFKITLLATFTGIQYSMVSYSPWRTLHLCDLPFRNWKFSPLPTFAHFTHLVSCLWQPQSVLWVSELGFRGFFFFFLISTYRWDHMWLVFLWFISLSVIRFVLFMCPRFAWYMATHVHRKGREERWKENCIQFEGQLHFICISAIKIKAA